MTWFKCPCNFARILAESENVSPDIFQQVILALCDFAEKEGDVDRESIAETFHGGARALYLVWTDQIMTDIEAALRNKENRTKAATPEEEQEAKALLEEYGLSTSKASIKDTVGKLKKYGREAVTGAFAEAQKADRKQGLSLKFVWKILEGSKEQKNNPYGSVYS